MVLLLLLWLLKLFEWKAEDSGERKSGDLGFGSRFNAILVISQFSSWCSRMVGLRSELFWSDFSAGLLPLEVSVEAPEESGFSDTHSETAPSTLTTMIKHNS
jgi:hypothetical protein